MKYGLYAHGLREQILWSGSTVHLNSPLRRQRWSYHLYFLHLKPELFCLLFTAPKEPVVPVETGLKPTRETVNLRFI